MKEFVFDIEANDLLEGVDTIWTCWFKEVGEDSWINVTSANEMKDFLLETRYATFIGHNILGYDLAAIEKVWGIDYGYDFWWKHGVVFVDTLVMSQYYSPDLHGGHGLENWGSTGRLGVSKIDYLQHLINIGALPENAKKGDEFKFYHPDMELYCKQDVKLTEKVYLHLKELLK